MHSSLSPLAAEGFLKRKIKFLFFTGTIIFLSPKDDWHFYHEKKNKAIATKEPNSMTKF